MEVGQIQRYWLGQTQQLLQYRNGRLLLLTTGLQNTPQHTLGVSPAWGAIAAPNFARDHHRTNGLFGTVVGRFQPRTIKKRKKGLALASQMLAKRRFRGER